MTVAFVRCTDANAAKNLITKQIWRKAEVLEGLLQNFLNFGY